MNENQEKRTALDVESTAGLDAHPIKFRGKRLDNDEWVYGYYVKRTPLKGKPKHYIYTEGYERWMECRPGGFYDGDNFLNRSSIEYYLVNPETVGQFTGLCNQSGEIYEKDILKYDERVWEIEWISQKYGWDITGWNMEPRMGDSYNDSVTIGNTVDNPEILMGI